MQGTSSLPSQIASRHHPAATETAQRLLETMPEAQGIYVGIIYSVPDSSYNYCFTEGVASREPWPIDGPPRRLLQTILQSIRQKLGSEAA